MTTPTTNYAFPKPVVAGSSNTWGTENNTCWDDVDAALFAVSQRVAPLETILTSECGKVDDFLRKTAPTGWTILKGTIGDATSGATYANVLAVNLFALLWSQFTDGELPLLTMLGVASTRGADAATDWAAHKRLTLPAQEGYFRRSYLSGTSGAIAAVQAAAILAHTHTITSNSADGTGTTKVADSDGTGSDHTITTTSSGGTENRPDNIAYLTCIKL